MKFKFTLTRRDGAGDITPTVENDPIEWALSSRGMPVAGGTGQVNAGGVFELDLPAAQNLDALLISAPPAPDTTHRLRYTVPRGGDEFVAALELLPYARPVVQPVVMAAALVSVFDIQANDATDWDWMIWETEGNSDPKYQRGGKQRELGLYRLNYDLLRKGGLADWQPAHADGTSGGGYVKVAFLEQLNYDQHKRLLKTFLPCFSVMGGRPREPGALVLDTKRVMVSRALSGDDAQNSLDVQPPFIVMPFNYDDNSSKSRAIGRDLRAASLAAAEVKRLRATLPRWATASRSTITAFTGGKVDLIPAAQNVWALRPDTPDDSSLPQVMGDSAASTLTQHQAGLANAATKYYSVKTGVDYVATQNQGVNGKDLLEANSIHAMSRSNVIAGVQRRVGLGRFEAGYQIEILSILLDVGGSWDGIQVREIGDAGKGEVWFPALSIPSHGKAFAEAWQPGCDWVEFWRDNFATPVGRAKAEMLAYFGLQHMTSNAQNFLIAFDRAAQGAARRVILRDIGDTLLNSCVFDVLSVDSELFASTWDHELADPENGIVLRPGELTIGGGYANPQITRIGTGIIFFFPPFLKGDLDLEYPARTAIAGKWGLAHNEGFMAYMRERVGYAEAWSAGNGAGDPEPANLRTHADLSRKGKSSEYKDLTTAVLALSAPVRQRLIGELKREIEGFAPVSSADVYTLQDLVAGHELLICAEIHCYLQGTEGKQALRDLHATGSVSQATGGAPRCLLCGAVKTARPVGSYTCATCQTWVCATCAAQLKYPRGTHPSLRARTVERMCCKQGCAGFAEPLEA